LVFWVAAGEVLLLAAELPVEEVEVAAGVELVVKPLLEDLVPVEVVLALLVLLEETVEELEVLGAPSEMEDSATTAFSGIVKEGVSA